MSNNKTQIRKLIKEERKNLDISKISQELVAELKNLEAYRSAKHIMIFYPLENEINLLSLLNDSSKNFYLPKICKENLLCCPYILGDELSDSCFKTKEPIKEPCNKNILDLIIVPALAVDKNGYRLGYGGGFYDRFLKDSSAYKIVCLPKQFLLETVFPQEHDIKMDKVITA